MHLNESRLKFSIFSTMFTNHKIERGKKYLNNLDLHIFSWKSKMVQMKIITSVLYDYHIDSIHMCPSIEQVLE